MAEWRGWIGLAVLVTIAWLFSERRSDVRWRPVVLGIVLQLVLGLVLLKLGGARQALGTLNEVVLVLQRATDAGTSFVFGYLGGGAAPYATENPQNSFILAFRALPLLLVVSAVSSLLFFWRVLPVIVRAFSWVLQRTMGIGGALGVGASANVFVGMTEAPLLVRPYLAGMSRSELFALMTTGMATIAGTVMVLYASILVPVIPDAMGHILVASLLSAPSALLLAGIIIPEPGETSTTSPKDVPLPPTATSSMDAITRGTLDGLQLWLNILAMLVVLLALVHLANVLLGLLPEVAGSALSLQRVLGWVMAPLMWLIGIPWADAQQAGTLMGIKTVLNELIAYVELSHLSADELGERSRLITMYALCGFANFGSLGIMIGGLGAMAPERRQEIVDLGLRSILAGTLATLMTGAVVGLLV